MQLTRTVKNPEAAVLFATGPSLSNEIMDICREYYDTLYFFGCNDSYLLCDFLDIHYSCDYRWWKLHHEIIDTKAPKWTVDEKARDEFGINWLLGVRGDDIYKGPDLKLHYGWNSGFQLINLAYHFGIRKFYLCGYNMGGDTHFFGDHPYPIRTQSPYDLFIDAFKRVSLPDITNCTKPTRLECFPLGDLREELEKL